MPSNRRIVITKRPKGVPTPADFALVKEDTPKLSDGEVLVRNHLLSLDPYMRSLMDGGDSYIPGLQLGDVMTGHTVGQVVISKHPDFKEGDYVWGPGQWQDFAVLKSPPMRKIDQNLAPLSAWLSPMGLPGWTAHIGFLDLCAPKSGETIVVSSASGAVGGFVGQLAREMGLKVVGISGGPEKCAYAVSELGYHACIDYKAADFASRLTAACPDGIDINFENVGGVILETIWPLLNNNARVLVCGLIAQLNHTSPYPGPDLMKLLKARATMRGFVILDHLAKVPDATRQMAEKVAAGTINYRTHVTDGLENAPEAFIGMLQGRNFGKAIVKIAS